MPTLGIDQITAFLYALKPKGIRFGLENTRLVLDNLDRPQDAFRAVHIAGSNGKGSTAAFLDAILQRGGVRVGLYTSPHLSHYRERFRVNGEPLPDAAIESVMDRFLREGLEVDPREVASWLDEEDMVRKMSVGSWYRERGGASQFCRLTFFECTTVLAMLLFADEGVELAVMEVGMGGRLDATNVLHPVVSVITPIHLEHTMWLGDTLAAIAGEKAGIIKDGVPVICARQHPEAMEVITREALCHEAPLSLSGRDFEVEGDWQQATFSCGAERFGPVHLGLAGRHQLTNAACAVACLPWLEAAGFGLPAGSVEQGLACVRWPARFEYLGAEGQWILDGAHNPDGVRALCQTVRDVFGDRRIRVIFGVLEDKNVEPMVEALAEVASHIDLVHPADARGRDPEALGPLVTRPGDVFETVAAALAARAEGPQAPILVTGSLTVVGEARAWLLEKGYNPKDCERIAGK